MTSAPAVPATDVTRSTSLFAAGDIVRWRDLCPTTASIVRQEHGPGPFTVEAVGQARCLCDAPNGQHAAWCPGESSHWSPAHPQKVTVHTKAGRCHIGGYYFEKVSETHD